MQSESLRNIKTMRQVKSSLEVANRQKIKTTNSLFKTDEESNLLETVGLGSGQTAQVLAKEKMRAAKFEASVERSRQKLLKSRKKIAGLVNRNRALTNLRHEIQHNRESVKIAPAVSRISPALTEIPAHNTLHKIELRY
jgi:LPS O-antigen subunit length determinant protein (WzzB/FepE family)